LDESPHDRPQRSVSKRHNRDRRTNRQLDRQLFEPVRLLVNPQHRIRQRRDEFTLLIDGAPAGSIQSRLGFLNQISWTGLDIGRDRGSPVSHYASPFAFTGKLIKVIVTMDDDQILDGDGVGHAELARD
jgi:hypothetical protein